MRIVKYIAAIGMVVAIAGMMPRAASAQVRFGIGIEFGAPAYAAPPPACMYGYYPYAPYACAPLGYYGPEWFANGVFIGAGPWFHGFYGPAFYGRRSLRFDDPAWINFHDHGGWRDFRNGDRWRDYRGGTLRIDPSRSAGKGLLGFARSGRQDRNAFRNRGFQGRVFRRNTGIRGGDRFRGFRGRGNPGNGRGFNGHAGFRRNGGGRGHGNHGHRAGH